MNGRQDDVRRRDDEAVGWMFLTMEPRFAGKVLRDLGHKKQRDAEAGALSKAKEMPIGEIAARYLWVYLEESMK